MIAGANSVAVPADAVRGTGRPRARGIEQRPDDQLDLVGRLKLRRTSDSSNFWADAPTARELVAAGVATFVLTGDPGA